jgi:hypothetical protein
MSDITDAYAEMRLCPKCEFKPIIAYEPGCHFTECFYKDQCPVRAAVPDWDPKGLAQRVNQKIEAL